MFEVYGFLAMFTAQIVILTFLHPVQLIARIRAQLARYPAEKFPQLYPEGRQWLERRLRFYRRLNIVIGIVGLALLGWFFNYMHQPDWSDGPVETLGAVFFMLQLSPILLFMWTAARRNQRLRHAIREQARKVVFERRGLFDFVSPVVVFATLLCYPLFIVFCVYLERNPFPDMRVCMSTLPS